MPATEGLRNEPNKFFVINSTGEHIDEPSRFWGGASKYAGNKCVWAELT